MSGLRIWLSGAIPDDLETPARDRLLTFVRTMGRLAFARGATVLHGCHPTLTGTLREEAASYRQDTGQRAPLVLIADRGYETGGCYLGQTPAEWRVDADFSTQGNASLMRDALAARADALVAVGGRWWQRAQDKAGVPQELVLAANRGLPCFVLGAFGGAAAGFVREYPEWLRKLRNGLAPEANQKLFDLEDAPEVMAAQVLEQINRLPLRRRETEGGQRYRILCLDGGGIRGAFTAALLAQWEELLRAAGRQTRLADHFDLIAGTSTGGIIALGLGLGLTSHDIAEFYQHEGPRIFSLTGVKKLCEKWIQRVDVKFDGAVLEDCLRSAYGQRTLADSGRRLLIPSYNLTSNRPTLFRTSHAAGRAPGHDHLLAIDIARATSAAPTYFKPAEVVQNDWSRQAAIDGGVWANCPAETALAEAVAVLGLPLDRIDLLSIGTAYKPELLADPALGGQLGWATLVADLLMNAQVDAALEHARRLLGDEHFVRLDDERPLVNSMDDPATLGLLFERGREVGAAHWDRVRGQFLNGVAAAPWRSL